MSTEKYCIKKSPYTLTVWIVLILFFCQSHGNCWWPESQPVITSTNEYHPDHPQAVALSRNLDRKLAWCPFHQTGIDLFLGYEMAHQNDPDHRSLWLKMFTCNHSPDFNARWSQSIPVLPENSNRYLETYSIAAGSYRPRHFVMKIPAVYTAFITVDKKDSHSILQVKQYFSQNSEDKISLKENPDFNIEIKLTEPGWEIVNTHICHLDVKDSFVKRPVIHLCWEEENRTTHQHRIFVTDITSGKLTVKPSLILANVTSQNNLNPRLDIMFLSQKEAIKSVKIRGLVCWEQAETIGDTISSTIGIQGYQTSGTGDNFRTLGPVLECRGNSPDSRNINPHVHMTHENNTRGTAIISWNSLKTDSQTYSLLAQTVWFDSSCDQARLFFREPSHQVIRENSPDLFTRVLDNSFCQPQSIDYDHSLTRLITCDQANHRVCWIDDPYPDLPGCWYVEQQVANNSRHFSTGEISRYSNGKKDPYFEVGQQFWSMTHSAVKNQFQLNSCNTDFVPIVTKTVNISQKPQDIYDLSLVSDSFSSLYLFYIQTNKDGSRTICWNSDTLMQQMNGSGYYRFTHPYDVSVIPSPPTPLPRSNGYWVADMGGDRLVRLNSNGNIEAMSSVDTVISPHAVSAAWDGSCWAIDWGRERVVKVDETGHLIASSLKSEDNQPGKSSCCIHHPSALDCGGDPETCYVADYEGNTVYKVTLKGGKMELIRSRASYFRPTKLRIMKTDSETIVWVADGKSTQPEPVPGTWTPVILPSPTPVPPEGQRFTPVPPTPFPENRRVTRNVFGESETIQWSATVPLGLSPVDENHCWVADRDAGSYMENEIRLLSSDGFDSFKGNIYHGLSRPVDIENVAPNSHDRSMKP